MPALDYGTIGRKGLSYSRVGTFKTCPRKFELENSLGLADRSETVTFSYGHACGAGVQAYFLHTSRHSRYDNETALKLAACATTRDYSMPWAETGTTKEQRAKKSIWYALTATEKFAQAMESALPNEIDELRDYELAFINVDGVDVPAIELQFRILLENDYVYEGHIDLIIRHKHTGVYAILELKTSGFRDVHDAIYANSDQALSYSIVLDKLVDGEAQSSYQVFYLVYTSPDQKWVLRSYPKEVKRRFDWINNIVRAAEIIEYYHSAAEDGIPYPTNGSACYEYFTPCRYFGVCHYDNSSLELLYKRRADDDSQVFDHEDNAHFIFTLEEIITAQVKLAESRAGIEGVSQIALEEID